MRWKFLVMKQITNVIVIDLYYNSIDEIEREKSKIKHKIKNGITILMDDLAYKTH